MSIDEVLLSARSKAGPAASGAKRRPVPGNALDLLVWAAEAAEEWERVTLRDRVMMVTPLFAMHVRELEKHAATAGRIGAGTGALLGGAWGMAGRDPAMALGQLFQALFVGVVLGAAGGLVAGRLYERAHGPLRPRVAATLPLWAEDRLRQGLVEATCDPSAFTDVPAWRVDGWRASWAALATEYAATASAAVMPPAGAPSLYELLREARHLPRSSSRG